MTTDPNQLEIGMPTPLNLGVDGVHPFSVLRSDLTAWQRRKQRWHELGIASRQGREGVSTYDSDSPFARAVLQTINDGLSTFDPVLTEACYIWYCPEGGRILDPFAGGSVRGLVAAHLGYHYTGIDLSARQVQANRAQAAAWAERDPLAGSVEWICGDTAELLPTLPVGAFDYVFTCPPYHNLERYTDLPGDLSTMTWDDFRDAYRHIISQAVRCLASDRFATWTVGEIRNYKGLVRGLVELTNDAHRAAGAHLYNDAVLAVPLASAPRRLPNQWRATRKMGRVHQYVLTFIKGDARKATQAIRDAAPPGRDRAA